MRTFALLATAALLPACTHVATMRSQDVEALSDDAAMTGASYSLPMIQFDIELTRALSRCDKTTNTPVLAIKAKSKERYLEGERFELDPSSLSSVFKTSAIGIEKYEDLDTLKSFNASADDQTGEVLVAVARTAIAIAGVTSGVPTMSFAAGANSNRAFGLLPSNEQSKTPVRSLRCTQAARDRLAALKTAGTKLETLAPQLTRQATLVTRQKELGLLRRFDATAMKTLLDLVASHQALEDQIAAETVNLETARDALSAPQALTWPAASARAPKASDLAMDIVYSDTPSKLHDFCNNFEIVTTVGGVETSVQDPTGVTDAGQLDNHCVAVLDLVAYTTQTRISLAPVTAKASAKTGSGIVLATTIPTDRAAEGLFYREPLRGSLIVEHLAGVDMIKGKDGEWTVVATGDPHWVPQLGNLRFLKFSSGPFENEALSLALRKDGRVEKLTYETKEAALARAASAAADVAEKVRTDREKREDRRRGDEKYLRETAAAERADEIAQLQYRIDILNKDRDLLKAQAGQSMADAELAQVNAEIATLTAKVARLKLTNEFAAMQPEVKVIAVP